MVTPVPKPIPPLPPNMPSEGKNAGPDETLSETHVYTSRPSASRVLRTGVPQLLTTSSYVVPCHELRTEVRSAGGVDAHPARNMNITVIQRMIASPILS